MRREAKRDDAEEGIVKALEAAGLRCQRLSDPGVPDLLVHSPRFGLVLLEVKAKCGALTKAQRGFQMPYRIVHDAQEALIACGVAV